MGTGYCNLFLHLAQNLKIRYSFWMTIVIALLCGSQYCFASVICNSKSQTRGISMKMRQPTICYSASMAYLVSDNHWQYMNCRYWRLPRSRMIRDEWYRSSCASMTSACLQLSAFFRQFQIAMSTRRSNRTIPINSKRRWCCYTWRFSAAIHRNCVIAFCTADWTFLTARCLLISSRQLSGKEDLAMKTVTRQRMENIWRSGRLFYWRK